LSKRRARACEGATSRRNPVRGTLTFGQLQ
jgi:hypothetical protein